MDANSDVSRETLQMLVLHPGLNVSRETISIQHTDLFSNAEPAENTIDNVRPIAKPQRLVNFV